MTDRLLQTCVSVRYGKFLPTFVILQVVVVVLVVMVVVVVSVFVHAREKYINRDQQLPGEPSLWMSSRSKGENRMTKTRQEQSIVVFRGGG